MRWLLIPCFAWLVAGCDASSSTPGGGAAATSTVQSEPSSAARATCRPLAASESCVAGQAQRPIDARQADRETVLAREGDVITSFGRRESFDAKTARWAKVSDCPVWQDVFVTDASDVYVEEPTTCSSDTSVSESCGPDDTGYAWRGLGVRHPAHFAWLPGGYAADDIAVYDRFSDGPLVGAHPETFEVLECGGSDGFVVGHERGADGEHWYRDGKPVDEIAAFSR